METKDSFFGIIVSASEHEDEDFYFIDDNLNGKHHPLLEKFVVN